MKTLDDLLLSHHKKFIRAFGRSAVTSNFHKILHLSELISMHGTVHDFSVCLQLIDPLFYFFCMSTCVLMCTYLRFVISQKCAVYERAQCRMNKWKPGGDQSPKLFQERNWFEAVSKICSEDKSTISLRYEHDIFTIHRHIPFYVAG